MFSWFSLKRLLKRLFICMKEIIYETTLILKVLSLFVSLVHNNQCSERIKACLVHFLGTTTSQFHHDVFLHSLRKIHWCVTGFEPTSLVTTTRPLVL